MGGRGASSSRGGSGGVGFSGASSFAEQQKYFKTAYGVSVGDAVGSLPSDARKAHLGGLDAVLSKYPGLARELSKVDVAETSRGRKLGNQVGADYNMRTGVVTINPKAGDIKKYDAESVRRLAAHEMGHALERSIAKGSYKTNESVENALRTHWFASGAVSDGLRSEGITSIRAGKAELGKISNYAAKGGRGEAFAEAFADHVMHGNNAKPISRAIMQQVSAYTSKLRRG